jgi:hypothetical protein
MDTDQETLRPVGPLAGTDCSEIVSPALQLVVSVSEHEVALVPVTVQVRPATAAPFRYTVNTYELPDPAVPLRLTWRLLTTPPTGIGA